MTTIYLTRHGETEWNLAHKFQGKLDSPLTEVGKQQAEWLSDRLKDVEFTAIYSSSSGRAFNTAEIVRGQRDMTIEAREELMEISLGPWEGRDIKGIEDDNDPNYHYFWNQPELYEPTSGESFQEVIERSYQVLKEIKEKHEGNVLVVSHGIVLKSILCAIEKKPLAELWEGPFMKQTSLTLLEGTEDGFKIVFAGDTSHHREFD